MERDINFAKLPKEKVYMLLKYRHSFSKTNYTPKENNQKKNELMLASDHNKTITFEEDNAISM